MTDYHDDPLLAQSSGLGPGLTTGLALPATTKSFPQVGDRVEVYCPECGEWPRGVSNGKVRVLIGSQPFVCWGYDMHRFKVTFTPDASGALRTDVESLERQYYD